MFKKPGKDQDIVEESIFGANQFDELIDWSLDRRNFEIYCNITGKWLLNDKFFKGRGKLLKKYDGSIFSDSIYILLEEGDLGKEDILIGRKVTIIKRPESTTPIVNVGKKVKSFLKTAGIKNPDTPLILSPNTYKLENHFKKDLQNQVFFRAEQEYDKVLEYLHSFTQKYQVSCHIEGILVSEDRQLQCIVTGVVKEVSEKEIFIQVIDAFDPSDPLNDDTKEFLTKNWIVQVSKVGLNKIHPEYLVFEIGEELALTKKVLSVEDVKVVLGGRTIIHDVNFEIQKGDIMGIIGESGAGKSTTLKAILGEFDYEGEIFVFGINAHKTKSIAPFIGYVPQDLSRMYSNFNALENIVAFGRQYGIPDDILIQRGKKILKDLGIDHVANQKVESLSGGQKRRVSIAISIVHNPYLIFLDEPTSGLDPLARYELWHYLDVINKEYGITLCVISHYLDEIEYCDYACIFLRGIGFYDFNTPMGLKSKLPGKGLALEVTLEDVTIEAIDLLANISGVDFVIQRGERIRILSDIPSFELSVIITEKLEKNHILIHSIELKVEIDMVDYFTVVSSVHQTQKYDEDGKLKEDVEGGALGKIGQNLSNEDVEISKVIKNAPKLTKKVVKKKKTAKKKKSSKKSSKKPKKKPTKKASKTPKSK